MAEISIDYQTRRHKGGATITCVLTLVGDILSASQAGTDAIGCAHMKPFTLCKQEVDRVRLCPRLFLTGNNLLYFAITAAIPFFIAAMQLFYEDPDMKCFIQSVIPGIACISALCICLQLLCCVGWCLEFSCRDGRAYLLPLVGYLIFPFQKYQREPDLALIREVKTWGNS